MSERYGDLMWVSWREAMDSALYGEGGFYRRGERPAHHFRTSIHASTAFAEAVLRLLVALDDALGHPDPLDLVDVGAGGGELLARIIDTAPDGLSVRLRAHAVEVAPRPSEVPAEISWREAVPNEVTGLIIANEWLDNVPVDVAELGADGPRQVLVSPHTGRETLGPALEEPDLAWLTRWWPLSCPGDRAEIGRLRDHAWASVVERLTRGVAVAIDYAHSAVDRPRGGTLAAYRDGGLVAPVPDGSCDITAHVALDACCAAGEGAAGGRTTLTTQHAALRALGITGTRPPYTRASTDPRGYLSALTRAGEEAELIDRAGLGSFGWLMHAIGVRFTL